MMPRPGMRREAGHCMQSGLARAGGGARTNRKRRAQHRRLLWPVVRRYAVWAWHAAKTVCDLVPWCGMKRQLEGNWAPALLTSRECQESGMVWLKICADAAYWSAITMLRCVVADRRCENPGNAYKPSRVVVDENSLRRDYAGR
jgi:hypothetical protein